MPKKKVYKNVYKEANQKATAQEGSGQGGGAVRRKPTFKSYILGLSIVIGYVSYFVGNTIVSLIAMGLFIVSGLLMGVQNIVFLLLGALMGFILSMMNDTDIFMTIALVWALFYTALMVSGFFMSRKKK